MTENSRRLRFCTKLQSDWPTPFSHSVNLCEEEESKARLRWGTSTLSVGWDRSLRLVYVQIQRKDRRTPNPQWSRVRRTLRDFITLWGLTPTQAPRVYKTNSKLKQETVLVLNGYFLFVMIIIILIIRNPLFKKIHVMTSDYSYNPDEWNHWKTNVWSEYFLIQN